MTIGFRSRMIERWRALLESRPTRNNVLAIAVPLGEMADLAIEILTGGEGVPRPPNYDPELFAEMRWTQPMTAEDIEQGLGFPSLAVDRDDDEVVFTLVDAHGETHRIVLPSTSAEQLCLAGLAVVGAIEKDAA